MNCLIFANVPNFSAVSLGKVILTVCYNFLFIVCLLNAFCSSHAVLQAVGRFLHYQGKMVYLAFLNLLNFANV